MPQNIDYADELHVGQHQFELAPKVPDGSFGDSQIGSTNPIDATKLKHQHVKVHAQPYGTAAASERKVVHVARSAGSVAAIEVGVVVAAVGAATVTLDVRKNGTSVLTSPVSLTSSQAAYSKVNGAISVAAYSSGDVFEIVLTATAGGGTLPQGVFCDAVFREGAG